MADKTASNTFLYRSLRYVAQERAIFSRMCFERTEGKPGASRVCNVKVEYHSR